MPFSEHMTAFATPDRDTKRRARRGLVVVALVAGLVGVAAPPASALFHLIKISEVYAGSAAQPTSQFIELQMYSGSQSLLTGHSVTVYDATGTEVGSFTFTSNADNATSQAYVLLATPDAETEFDTTADLAMTPALRSGGGKVCFAEEPPAPVDCASWGTFSADDPDAGDPFNPPIGIVPGQSMTRDISAGNATQLEESDDTNNSSADFDSAAPSPTNNAGDGGGGGGGGGEEPAEHDRAVTLTLRRHLRASGAVTSDETACVGGAEVRIQRRGTYGFRTVKRVQTSAEGRFSTTLRDRPGRYRASVAETSPNENTTCLAANSPARTHRH
jgi:hypothetical protein